MTKLRISGDLTLPLEAITETIAILGIRGSGKTNTAAVYAEELLRAGQQVVIIDPTDSWWGLKSSADGKAAGYPVVVLGGKYADLPLGSGDGKLVADFVVEQSASVICSLRGFESKQQELAFTTAFLRRLYHLKGQQSAPTPIALIIDEASRLVPQRVMGEDAACVGAVQQLVRQGRSSGFGVILIDQRPATVNKDVLTQMEMLIVHRTTSPQDRKALREWVEQHDAADNGPEFLDTLASLNLGDAWVWSPGWLDLFKKVHVRERHTFDSSRTPRAGEMIVAPKKIADVDLASLRAKLAATVEKAKSDDPKELRKEIATLKKQLATPTRDGKVIVTHDTMVSQIDAAVQSARAGWTREMRRMDESTVKKLGDALGRFLNAAEAIEAVKLTLESRLETVPTNGHTPAPRAVAPRPPVRATPSQPVDGVTAPQQRILDALAGFESMGITQMNKSVAAVFADQSPTSSGYANNLGRLRSSGLINYPTGGMLALTDTGRAGATGLEINSVEELHAAWEKQLPAPQWKIVAQAIRVHPDGIDRDALADLASQSSTSSGYANNLGRLRSLGLIEYKRGNDGTLISATDLLFPDGLR